MACQWPAAAFRLTHSYGNSSVKGDGSEGEGQRAQKAEAVIGDPPQKIKPMNEMSD